MPNLYAYADESGNTGMNLFDPNQPWFWTVTLVAPHDLDPPAQEKHQYNSQDGTLRLDPGTTKNGEGRVVKVTSELRALLDAQLTRVREIDRQAERVIPWLFPHLEGALAGQRISDPRKAWESTCKAAGLPGLLIHDLRRSAVRNMEQAGVPRSVAMKLTGHKTENVYRRYAIVSDADLDSAAVRLAEAASRSVSRSTASA
jgi:integrase